MGQVFVRASSRAKAYTRSTAKHRLFQKTFKKGSYRKRAAKALSKTSASLGYANMTGSAKRAKQLNKRKNFLVNYLR